MGEYSSVNCDHEPFLLQMVVAGMAAYTDISKAHEIANEVRRVNKQLKEAQGLASTYNNRERLFGMPVTNVSTRPYTMIGAW